MGGRALKNIATRRYNRDEFEVLKADLMSQLREDFFRVDMPLYYREKESFGDADFLVTQKYQNTPITDYIKARFKPHEIVHNGPCYSFDYKRLQIDLIFVSPEHFDSTLNYFSFNDLGNLIGRLAHGFGLKYGQEGLVYTHYFKGKNIGEIHITKDMRKICEFLDLDYERYILGFDNLKEIFDFVIKSQYFNYKSYQFDQLNKINRDRNKKRSTYEQFLNYIEDYNDRLYPFEKDKSVYLDRFVSFFPEADITCKVRELEYEECKKLYVQSKFSGKHVMDKYGFTGSSLGTKMTGFKNFITSKLDVLNYDELILNMTREDIFLYFDLYLSSGQTTSNHQIISQ